MIKDLRLKNIKKYFKSINRESRGFTLIELLVVIAILGFVGSIVAGVITLSLRGTNKTNTIENLRQSGNYTISQMSKTIEYAEVFEGLKTDSTDYVTSCPVIEPTPTPTLSNYSYIKIKPFNNTSIVYRCEELGPNKYELTSNDISLIDTTSADSQTTMSSCTFTCTVSGASDFPVIGIRFVLEPKTSSILVEKFTPPITFETSVTMRNYQR